MPQGTYLVGKLGAILSITLYRKAGRLYIVFVSMFYCANVGPPGQAPNIPGRYAKSRLVDSSPGLGLHCFLSVACACAREALGLQRLQPLCASSYSSSTYEVGRLSSAVSLSAVMLYLPIHGHTQPNISS